MVNPGAFSGQRKAFLDAQKEVYAAAVAGDHVNDTVADIQRRYFKRFPITLAHTEEPTEEQLAAVDDDAPDPEWAPPREEGLSPDAYSRAKRVYEFQCNELKMRKAQIKRRLQYEYSKTQSQRKKFEMGTSDPMAVLATKLTGVTVTKPRLRTAYNIWGPNNRCFVDPVFQERVWEGKVPARQHAALRSAIYKEMFEELPESEKQEWTEKAEREHREALEKLSGPLKDGPSTAPQDRQRIIQCFPDFMQDVLDLLEDHTGWKFALFAGGPVPADGGRLAISSVHSGTTSGAVKMTFGRSERVAIKDLVMPTFSRFLKKCYSVQECRERALPEDSELVGLAWAEERDRVEYHAVEDNRFTEESNYVRMVPPCPNPPTIAKSNPIAGPADCRTTKSLAKVSLKLPPVKFGPPRNGTKTAGGSTLVDTSAMPSSSNDAVERPVGGLPGSSGAPSRGPSPLVSRAPTPDILPLIDSSGVHSSPPACLTPQVSTELAGSSAAIPAVVPTEGSGVGAAVESTGSANSSDGANSASEHSAASPPSCSASTELPATLPSAAAITEQAASAPTLQLLASSSADATQLMDVGAVAQPQDSCSPPDISHTPVEPGDARVIPSCFSPPPARDVRQESPDRRALPLSTTHALQQNASRSPAHPPGSTSVPDMQALEAEENEKRARKRKGRALSTGPRSKKRKAGGRLTTNSESTGSSQTVSAAGSQDSSTTLVNAPGAPAWVTKSLQLFQSASLGPEWDALVSKWIEMERGSGFEEGSARLGATNRPSAVTDWIRRARVPLFRPEIKSIKTFSAEFNAWWASLQPDWRSSGPTDLLLRDGGDWECLRCPGINGLLSVLAALFFGGRIAQKLPARAHAHATWLKAVDDVSYVIAQLL